MHGETPGVRIAEYDLLQPVRVLFVLSPVVFEELFVGEEKIEERLLDSKKRSPGGH